MAQRGTPLVTTRLDDGRRERLAWLESRLGLSRSDVIRIAIDRLAELEAAKEDAAA